MGGTKRREKAALILQHIDFGNAAILERSLRAQGVPTFTRHPYLGDEFPDLSGVAGVLSMGGPMSVNDVKDHAWIEKECAYLRAAVDAGLPVVGICLGGQLLAKALGAEVETNAEPEVGWYPVNLTDAGRADPVLGTAGPSPIVYHWHMDTFHLPPGAELLASSRACARQAFRVGPKVYGFQFHPEADHQLIEERFERLDNVRRIQLIQSARGRTFVQDPPYHRALAPQGERSSLRIAAALARVFRERAFEPVPPGFKSLLESFAIHRTDVELRIRARPGHKLRLTGVIYQLLTLPHGQYAVVQGSSDRLLWPVRLDDIQEAVPLDARSNRLG